MPLADSTRIAEMPCIRCGDCANVCPERLQPQQLLWDLRAGQPERARQHGLFDCSQCGLCDLACPSGIALLQRFRAAMSVINERDLQLQEAGAARERFASRERRLQRELIERSGREAALTEQAASSDAVAAAIERAQARRKNPGEPK